MRISILVGVALMVTGCGHPQSPTQLMQRFDSLGPDLNRVTLGSGLVAADVATVNLNMRGGTPSRIQKAAARLAVDALRLSADAGRVGSRVTALLKLASEGNQRRYMLLVLTALRQQWMEGQELRKVANVIWGDPLIMSPRDSTDLTFAIAGARRRAGAAVGFCVAARRVRSRNAAMFRY